MQPVVYFAGDEQTVGHHAAPLAAHCDVRVLPPDQIIDRARPGEVVVFYTEHFDVHRQACVDLKARNVATLYMIDGILEWRNAWLNSPQEIACPFTMRPALSHKVACIGAAQGRTLASWGNAGKVEIVGIPRLDRFKKTPPRPRDDQDAFRVLVMTAKTPAFTADQRKTVRRSLQDISQWATANPTVAGKRVEWIWRLTSGLDRDLQVPNQLHDFHGADLNQVLHNVDAVITTPSTATLEAIRLNLPVAQLDYHNCPHYLQSGWDIATREHIGPAVFGMASGDAARLQFQAEQLADGLYEESDASDRLATLVLKMSEIAARQIRSGQPVAFPPNLLPVPTCRTTEFDHATLFGREEFKQTQTNELQAQLAHSRREIERLDGQVNELKRELAQAHRIFETINSHPIAGPVVRIRQNMLDWMAKIRPRKNSNAGGEPSTESSGRPQNTPPEK